MYTCMLISSDAGADIATSQVNAVTDSDNYESTEHMERHNDVIPWQLYCNER